MIKIEGQNNDLHDSIIWAMRFDDSLYFDIDCLVGCEEKEGKILNSIIPLKLIFHEVENFKIEIMADWINGLEVDQITLVENDNRQLVKLILQEGEISFSSKSHESILRGSIILTSNSCLTEEERGGYNFEVSD